MPGLFHQAVPGTWSAVTGMSINLPAIVWPGGGRQIPPANSQLKIGVLTKLGGIPTARHHHDHCTITVPSLHQGKVTCLQSSQIKRSST